MIIKYLVRRLTIRDDKRKERILPLVILSGLKEGDILSDLSISPFEEEIEGTEYLSELKLAKITDKPNFKIL